MVHRRATAIGGYVGFLKRDYGDYRVSVFFLEGNVMVRYSIGERT